MSVYLTLRKDWVRFLQVVAEVKVGIGIWRIKLAVMSLDMLETQECVRVSWV